ncbi:MAG TPA: DUF2231 domain-containing protein [Capsulimonadaceae bacterium]
MISAYPGHDAAIRRNSCANCHVSPSGGPRNAYGLAIEKAFKASGDDDISADTLKSVESTPEGAAFAAAINADQNPGAPAAAAKPAAPKPATPPAASAKPAAKPAASSAHPAATPAPGKPSATTVKPATAAAPAPVAATPAPTATPTPAATPVAAAPASATSAPAAAPVAEPAPASEPTPKGADDGKPPFGIPDYAFHPAIVHFPIALFIGGLVLDFLGYLKKDKPLLFAGWFNLALAATSALGAVASGFAAMMFMKLPLEGLIAKHMLLAMIVTVMMWAMFGLRAHQHESMRAPARIAYYFLALLTFVLVSYVGHLGGEFVYGH